MLTHCKSIKRSLGLFFESSGRLATANVIILLLRSLLPVLIVLLIKYYIDSVIVINEVTAKSLTAGMTGIISALALALLSDDLLSSWSNYTSKKQAYFLERHITNLIHCKTANLGLKFFEDPSYHDMLSRAVRDISWRPAGIVADLVFLLRGVISFLAMAFILIKFSFIAILLMLIAFVPVFMIKMNNSARLYSVRRSVTSSTRHSSYFSWLLTGERPARETKLFNLHRFFEELFSRSYNSSKEEELKVIRKNALLEMVMAAVKILVFAGIILYASVLLVASSITVGEMAMYLVAMRQAMIYLRDAVSGLSGLNESRLFVNDLFLFLDMKSDMTSGKRSIDPSEFKEIEISNLTFTYPGSTIPAIKNISLKIGKGERLAIVGPNGSGKTTLVKLLTRLYDPDSGLIRINGEAIKEFHLNEYRRLYSVVFQDYMLYYLTAAENISLGDTASGKDDLRIRAASRKAGIDDFLEKLPEKYDTILGHHTQGGRELSWGEWQKIAIARALYREAPLLVLDEPSSALDADAEYEIFSKLDEITEGRTSILISHRLAYAAQADKIIVLENGSIAEAGTHDELILAEGKYFSMFSKQKALYK